MKYILSIVFIMFILQGCGDSEAPFDNPTQEPEEVEVLQTGQLGYPLVEGITYSRSSTTRATTTGVTDANGSFYYKEGEDITFSLGNLTLGSVEADTIITPIELGGSDDFANLNTKSSNINLLLYNLDQDRNNSESNIITISTFLEDYDFSTLDLEDVNFSNDLQTLLNDPIIQENIDKTDNSFLDQESINNLFKITLKESIDGTYSKPTPIIPQRYNITHDIANSSFQCTTDLSIDLFEISLVDDKLNIATTLNIKNLEGDILWTEIDPASDTLAAKSATNIHNSYQLALSNITYDGITFDANWTLSYTSYSNDLCRGTLSFEKSATTTPKIDDEILISEEDIKTGVLGFPVVQGLKYATDSQSGITNVAGEFLYVEDENITFTLGNFEIANIKAKDVLTFGDLGGSTDISDPNTKSINIAMLFYNLDEDRNNTTDNILTISDGLESYLLTSNLLDDANLSSSLFTNSVSSLLADTNIQERIDNNHSLISFATTSNNMTGDFKTSSTGQYEENSFVIVDETTADRCANLSFDTLELSFNGDLMNMAANITFDEISGSVSWIDLAANETTYKSITNISSIYQISFSDIIYNGSQIDASWSLRDKAVGELCNGTLLYDKVSSATTLIDEEIAANDPVEFDGLLIPLTYGLQYYKTSASDPLFTDDASQFTYIQSDTLTFRIGDLTLGSTTADNVISILDLSGDTNFDTPSNHAKNIMLLLKNLDQKRDITSSMEISPFLSHSNVDLQQYVTNEAFTTTLLTSTKINQIRTDTYVRFNIDENNSSAIYIGDGTTTELSLFLPIKQYLNGTYANSVEINITNDANQAGFECEDMVFNSFVVNFDINTSNDLNLTANIEFTEGSSDKAGSVLWEAEDYNKTMDPAGKAITSIDSSYVLDLSDLHFNGKTLNSNWKMQHVTTGTLCEGVVNIAK